MSLKLCLSSKNDFCHIDVNACLIVITIDTHPFVNRRSRPADSPPVSSNPILPKVLEVELLMKRIECPKRNCNMSELIAIILWD